MWLNAETNSEFTSLFGINEYPKIVILNIGKRKKFLIHDCPVEAPKLRNIIIIADLLKLIYRKYI